jgi:hypothetical protein
MGVSLHVYGTAISDMVILPALLSSRAGEFMNQGKAVSMKAPRLASFTAVAAAFFYLGCFTAAAQPAAAPEQPAVRSIIAAPAAKKASTSQTKPSARKPSAKDTVHVYLLRGLLNVFSLGMDELADKIKAIGIEASVHNHTEWEELAGQITANYKAGNHAPIILIGHSLGADAVMYMGSYLGKRGVPVALIVPFDGTQSMAASANVARVMNITQRDYAYMRRGSGFHGELSNVDVSAQGVDHLSIDKSDRLHAMVLSKISAVVKRGETSSDFATAPTEREHTVPVPKPAPVEAVAKPEPANDAVQQEAQPTAQIASKPLTQEPAKSETNAVAAPVATTPNPAPASVPVTPAVSVAVSPTAPHPVAAPAASAPQPVSVPAAPVTSAAPQGLPAPERLEYEKLVLPKQ